MSSQLVDYNRVNLVNDYDEIVGSADKLEAHLGEAMLHQAISLFLFKKNQNSGFDLLIQKRSQQKTVGANQWANTVCGNVAWGENHQQCLWRRLREELGIVLTKDVQHQAQKIITYSYQVTCNEKYSEKEIDHIFAIFLNDQQVENLSIKLNPLEVSEFAWVSWSDLTDDKQFATKEFTPWFKLFLADKQVKRALDYYLKKYQLK